MSVRVCVRLSSVSGCMSFSVSVSVNVWLCVSVFVSMCPCVCVCVCLSLCVCVCDISANCMFDKCRQLMGNHMFSVGVSLDFLFHILLT